MMNKVFKACFVASCFTFAIPIAYAQQSVHALSGTVTSINSKISMIEIDTDDGTSGHFRLIQKSDGSINFDKAVSSDATAADKFTTKGSHVIVYYFGVGTVRTAVALHDLGDGSVETNTGTVVKLNRHDRLLTIKNSEGTELSYQLDPKTVADTAGGVSQGLKFDFSKGASVRVIAATPATGSSTALLIAPVM